MLAVFTLQLGNWNSFTVLQGGNVGIGTTSPGVPLHVVRTTAGTAFRLQETAANLYTEMQFQTPTGNMYIFVNSSGYSSYGGANSTNFYTSNGAFAFHSNAGNNHFYIANGGNIGIGTTLPGTYKLNVVGTALFSGSVEMAGGGAVYQGQKFYLDGGGDSYMESPSSNVMHFYTNGIQRARITDGGNFIIGTETSTACTLKVSSTKNGSESSPHFV